MSSCSESGTCVMCCRATSTTTMRLAPPIRSDLIYDRDKGQRNPTVVTLWHISKALGVKIRTSNRHVGQRSHDIELDPERRKVACDRRLQSPLWARVSNPQMLFLIGLGVVGRFPIAVVRRDRGHSDAGIAQRTPRSYPVRIGAAHNPLSLYPRPAILIQGTERVVRCPAASCRAAPPLPLRAESGPECYSQTLYLISIFLPSELKGAWPADWRRACALGMQSWSNFYSVPERAEVKRNLCT